jgi:soluble lytic murein transglycosylase-like protein
LATLFYNQYKEYHQNYFSGNDINRLVSKIFRPKVLNFYCKITEANGQIVNNIINYALKYDLPLHLTFALAYKESGFNPNATNYNTGGSKDRGLFQLNNIYFKFNNERDVYNIEINTMHGLRYLRFCYEVANYNSAIAVLSYNMGSSNALRCNGVIPNFRKDYVNSILSYEKYLDRRFNEYGWK